MSDESSGAVNVFSSYHGKAPVVNLHYEPLLPLLVAHALVEPKGIVEVEGEDAARSVASKRRVRLGVLREPRLFFSPVLLVGELSGLAAPHVVRLLVLGDALELVLVPELQRANGDDDLPFADLGEGIPERRHGAYRSQLGPSSSIHLHGERPCDALGVDDVAYEGSHRDTTVLDL